MIENNIALTVDESIKLGNQLIYHNIIHHGNETFLNCVSNIFLLYIKVDHSCDFQNNFQLYTFSINIPLKEIKEKEKYFWICHRADINTQKVYLIL